MGRHVAFVKHLRRKKWDGTDPWATYRVGVAAGREAEKGSPGERDWRVEESLERGRDGATDLSPTVTEDTGHRTTL